MRRLRRWLTDTWAVARGTTAEPVTATVVWARDTGEEEIRVGTHHLAIGGPGDGYCYEHANFACIDLLTPAERDALANAETTP